ncbi:MAG: signal transduction histidine kinase, LytS [Fluviicola sp.]|jgi:tetratricopeptide (TPR) repeat protein|uniref:tetratricopeptide repeat-containing sensor histidine kinase n=1 Tax=Fluviicola sp. TaxID=1917219 RepID=UPI002620C314|nr:histidine kinase [Fluviicola sp.]MDF3028283.1 signal transduction histidine kinase, LytS [Fluviicola sp.]
MSSPNSRLKRTSLLMMLFLSCSYFNYAQLPMDSLLRKIQYQNEDTNKVKLYYDIGRSYFAKDKSLFKVYTDSSFRLARKLKYSNGLGLAYAAYGFYYSLEKDWDKMKFNLQKSDSIYEKTGNISRIIRNKEIYSNYYNYFGEYDKALKNDLAILKYYEKNGPKTSEAKMLGSVALLFTSLQRYKEAEVYYKKSIALRKELKDQIGQSTALLNLGAMLAERGLYSRAKPYLEESLQLQKTLKNEQNTNIGKANLAHVYSETGKPVKALKLVSDCRPFFERTEDTTNLVTISIYESIAYMRLKQYDRAIKALNQKYHYIKNRKHYSELESDLLWQYYRVYKAMGKTDEALEYFEEAKALNDFSQKMEVQHNVSRMKEQFETEKKQRENEKLKQENQLKDLQISQRNYLVFGSILLLILICVIAFTTIRYNRLKAGKVAVEMEQRLLQSQMNPHFIFNVLHAIHTFMLKKDTEESGKLLTSFARLVRSILQHSSTDNITLSEELKWLKDYMRLQQLRFSNSFDYAIEIEEELSPDNLLLPPMLIQPFIENAIEHGFSELDKKGELIISYKKIAKEVQIRITDNGKGFSANEPVRVKKDHESLAIQITEKRILLLNKRRKGAFKFEIVSKPLEGTTILFSIPYHTLFD